MASYFGEIQELVSRADEFDELDDLPNYNLIVETSDNYSSNFACETLIFCVGEIAVGFSKCFLFSDKSEPLLEVYYTSGSDQSDSLLYGGKISVKNKATAATVYFVKPGVTVCEIPFNIPETIYTELLQLILQYVKCTNSVVLTSASSANLKGDTLSDTDESCLMSLTTSTFSNHKFNVPKLPSPNFVSGIPAAVLTEFEIQKKPAVCVINYVESNAMDFASIKSFEDISMLYDIQQIMNKNSHSLLLNYVNKHSRSNLYM